MEAEELTRLMPAEAHSLADDGSTRDVPIGELSVGDRVLVKPGKKFLVVAALNARFLENRAPTRHPEVSAAVESFGEGAPKAQNQNLIPNTRPKTSMSSPSSSARSPVSPSLRLQETPA